MRSERYNILFLGTGTSHGVPPIDCMLDNFAKCPKGVCMESLTDQKHNRTRCSIIVSYSGASVLVDVSADFRAQILRERVRSIDAVLITHAHADHISGIPDIRSYTRDQILNMYGSQESIERIMRSFDYIFNPPEMLGGGIPRLNLLAVSSPFDLFGEKIIPVPVEHGSLTGTFGFRIGPIAYIPDLKNMTAHSRGLIAGAECLIIDALRDERPHTTHMILPESIAFARELGVKKTYFTHLCHNIHYITDGKKLDDGMMFAYDGLKISL
jgi:phosphoribosyl 1,2-cyclic phosphate phosphodiesterase